MAEPVNKTISIQAPLSKVWENLTKPDLMKQWVSEGQITIDSDWKAGSAITFTGKWHGVDYRDKGTILKFEKEKVFQYSYWSEFTGLADKPENYTIVEFKLTAVKNKTMLSLSVNNIATEAMYGHIKFYWNTTLELLKKLIENN